MRTLMKICEVDMSYLEIPLIQTIIKFKWETYTKRYFLFQSLVLITFIICFILDVIFKSKEYVEISNDTDQRGQLTVRIICCICVGYYSLYELV